MDIRISDMATGQQAFTLGEDLKGAFRRFCEDQGLDPKLVFLAGWRALDRANHQVRGEWFEGLTPWQSEILERWGPNGQASKSGGTEAERTKQEGTRMM